MSDEIDAAQEIEDFDRTLALKKALAGQRKEEPLVINGRRCCLTCEGPIPQKRLEANPDAVRCTPCQARKERRS